MQHVEDPGVPNQKVRRTNQMQYNFEFKPSVVVEEPGTYVPFVLTAAVILSLIIVAELVSWCCNGCSCSCSCCACCRRWRSRGMRASSKPDAPYKSRYALRHEKRSEVSLGTGPQCFTMWPDGVARGGSPTMGDAPSALLQKERRSLRGGRFADKARTPGFFFEFTSQALEPYQALDQMPYLCLDPFLGMAALRNDGVDITQEMRERLVCSPEEVAKVTMAHLGKPKAFVAGEEVVVEWVPHVASRLRQCRMVSITDVGVMEKQSVKVVNCWIDETVVRTLLASRPCEKLTIAQVSRWYSANNTMLLSADPNVRLMTAVYLERFSESRLRSVRDFTSRPDGE